MMTPLFICKYNGIHLSAKLQLADLTQPGSIQNRSLFHDQHHFSSFREKLVCQAYGFFDSMGVMQIYEFVALINLIR
jgi:hypothetical protein